MEKIVKKWGNSLVVIFNPDDKELYSIEEGDVIEFEDIKLYKRKKKLNSGGKNGNANRT